MYTKAANRLSSHFSHLQSLKLIQAKHLCYPYSNHKPLTSDLLTSDQIQHGKTRNERHPRRTKRTTPHDDSISHGTNPATAISTPAPQPSEEAPALDLATTKEATTSTFGHAKEAHSPRTSWSPAHQEGGRFRECERSSVFMMHFRSRVC